MRLSLMGAAMFKHIEFFVLGVIAVLSYSSVVPAAIFEVPHILPPTTSPGIGLQWLNSPVVKGSDHAATLDDGINIQFPAMTVGLPKSEDLLWIAMANAGRPAFNSSLRGTDTASHLVEGDRLPGPKPSHIGATRAPTEGAAPELWAVILIGAGLIWSQLRHKNRRSAIRFHPQS